MKILKIQGLWKIVLILCIVIAVICGVFLRAQAQAEFLFGLVIGTSISGEEQVFSSNLIYLNEEILEEINIEEVRFVRINIFGYICNESRTIKEIFEKEKIIKAQIEEDREYEWIGIWREDKYLIFAFILK